MNRSLIRKFQREKETLLRIGMRSAKRIGIKARVAAMRTYKRGGNVGDAVFGEFLALEPLIIDSMVAGHLSGRFRVLRTAVAKMPPGTVMLGPYDSATEFLKKKLKVSDVEAARLRKRYGDVATDVTRKLGMAAELKAEKAVAIIVQEGMHVREGVATLGEALTRAGIDPQHPWLIETLVRSQIAIAYSAGRWNGNQDPAVKEILWGYEYWTVGDERVRISHEALEGTSLPKESPEWNSIWPPNGFSCRCETVEVFRDEPHKTVEVPDTKEVRGQDVTPGPDEGWDMNHGQVYSDVFG